MLIKYIFKILRDLKLISHILIPFRLFMLLNAGEGKVELQMHFQQFIHEHFRSVPELINI